MNEEIKDVTQQQLAKQKDMDNENNEMEELTLEDFGEKLNEEIKDSEKPIFESNTPAVIKDIKIKRAYDPNVDKQGRQYYPIVMTINTLTNDDQESFDNYGGLRETEEGTLWSGSGSAFGKLMKLAKEEDANIKTYADFFNFLKDDRKVKIRTETTTYQDKEYKKNMIRQFV